MLLVATAKQAYCNRTRWNPSHCRIPQIQAQRRRRRRRRRRRPQIWRRRRKKAQIQTRTPPTSPEAAAVALFSGCMEVAE
jgi:hypothetical protein